MRLYGLAGAVFLTVLLSLSKHVVLSKPTISTSGEKKSASDITSLRIEAFKQKILENLGYSSPPNVTKFNNSIATKRQKIRDFREYLKSKNDMRLIPESDTGEITFHRYIFKGRQRLVNISSQYEATVIYNLQEKHPDDPQEELLVKSATMKLYKTAMSKNRRNAPKTLIKIAIYKIDRNSNGELFRGLELDSRILDTNENGWETFDISPAVQTWIDNPESNHGLAITSDTHNVTHFLTLQSDEIFIDFNTENITKSTSSNISLPTLEFVVQQRSLLKRTKRDADWIHGRDCREGDGETRCCRYRILINFHEIGWNWVIAPDSYQAFYCEGHCPEYYKMAYTFTGIKSLLHRKDPKKFSSPCCVPSSLKPLTILHEDANGELMFNDQQNMIVEDCKCA